MQLLLFPMPDTSDRDEQIAAKVESDIDYGPERDEPKADACMRKGFALMKEGDDLLRRADAAEQSTAVSSDDPEAVAKLRAQLAEAEERAAAIVESVKRARKVERPWTRAKFEAAAVCEHVARACLLLNVVPSLNTNANANVRRLKERIAELEAKAATPAPAAERHGDAIESSGNRQRKAYGGAMAIKFEKITEGMRLYDCHRTKMGNTTMSRLGLWDVHIISVDADKRTAMVRWNGNPPQLWREKRLTSLYREPPKKYTDQRSF